MCRCVGVCCSAPAANNSMFTCDVHILCMHAVIDQTVSCVCWCCSEMYDVSWLSRLTPHLHDFIFQIEKKCIHTECLRQQDGVSQNKLTMKIKNDLSQTIRCRSAALQAWVWLHCWQLCHDITRLYATMFVFSLSLFFIWLLRMIIGTFYVTFRHAFVPELLLTIISSIKSWTINL